MDNDELSEKMKVNFNKNKDESKKETNNENESEKINTDEINGNKYIKDNEKIQEEVEIEENYNYEMLINIIGYNVGKNLPPKIKNLYVEQMKKETIPILKMLKFGECSLLKMIDQLSPNVRFMIGLGYLIYESYQLKVSIRKNLKTEIKKELKEEKEE